MEPNFFHTLLDQSQAFVFPNHLASILLGELIDKLYHLVFIKFELTFWSGTQLTMAVIAQLGER